MSVHTGKSVEDVARETDRDNFLTAEEALAFGIVDKVLQKRCRRVKSGHRTLARDVCNDR